MVEKRRHRSDRCRLIPVSDVYTRGERLHKIRDRPITRCFDEIEVLELPILQVKNRARKLYAAPDKRAMWQTIQPVLRNPIIKEFRLAEIPQADLPLSGLSALAEYSMLTDNPYPTVAFEKVQIHWSDFS